MSTVEDVSVVLLRANVVSAEQLEAAQAYQQKAGGTLEEWLIQFGYITAGQAAWAVAQAHQLPYIDLTGVSVPATVIELVPESVARENVIFPLKVWPGGLLIAVADPTNQDTLQKLRFILNREIHVIVAAREQIFDAIERHYGEAGEVSVDSCLAEFTETSRPSAPRTEVIDLEAELSKAEGRAACKALPLQEMLCRLRESDNQTGEPRHAKTRVYSEGFEFTDSAARLGAMPAENRAQGRRLEEELESCEFDLAMEESLGEVDSLCDEELGAPSECDTMSAGPAAKAGPARRQTMLALDDAARDASVSMTGVPMAAPAPGVFKRSVGRAFGTTLLEYKPSKPLVERHATVRFYYRMNPQRMFPMLVILSKKTIQQVVKKAVTQKQSEQFQVALDSYVEIEPILPGCQVYPPKDELKVEDREVSTRFWVVPNVLGEVMHARVVIRQDGQVLTEVPLEIQVMRQSAALIVGALSFLLPFGLFLLQHFGMDFGAQLHEGMYAQTAGWVIETTTPELLTALLLGVTAGVWLWLRPRERDVFWDILPHDPRKDVQPARNDKSARAKPSLNGHPQQADLFQQAERNLRWQRHAMALHLFEKGLALGKAPVEIYADASLAAASVGRIDRALEILEQAESELGSSAIKGPMWYRMASLATRLGRQEMAMGYLKHAIEAGSADPERLQSDPELAPLRARADFQWLTPVCS